MAARPHDADEPEAVEPGAVGLPSGDVPPADLPPGEPSSDGVPSAGAAPADDPGSDENPSDENRSDENRSAAGQSDGEPVDVSEPVDVTEPAAPRAARARPPAGPDRIGPLPDDVEARWLELVAQLEAPSDTLDRPEPGAPRAVPPAAPPAEQVRVVRPATPTGPRAWSPDPAVEEAEDHFEPPEPGPVLGGDPLLTMAWTAVAGVPALLLVAVVAWRDIPVVVLEAAGVAFLGAVGLLVWRMPHRRDDDSGPGAVV